MNREYEYSWKYFNWTIKCLIEDEKYEELAFFRLGIDLLIRQSELINLTFEQFDFPYVKDIRIMKPINGALPKTTYQPKTITINTYDAVNKISKDGKARLFDKPAQYYVDSIRKSNGDMYFNGHMMRSLGLLMTVGSATNEG